MTDRAVPFTLSIKMSQIARLERVLNLAASQGRLQSGPNRTNKLAAELLLQALATLEQEYAAQGLLPEATLGGLPSLPIAPTAYALPLPVQAPQSAPSAASDPAYRAQVRAAHDARTARLSGGAFTPPTLAELEAAYRAQGAESKPLEAPAGIDWDRAP
jgi:hypothetical protein